MANKRPLHQHLYTCLGEIITHRRHRLGLSQESLAADSGVDRAFISDLERGKRNPSFGVVASIAGGLRMRYSRLVHRCETCALDKEKSG